MVVSPDGCNQRHIFDFKSNRIAASPNGDSTFEGSTSDAFCVTLGRQQRLRGFTTAPLCEHADDLAS